MSFLSRLKVKRVSIDGIDRELRKRIDTFIEDHDGTVYHETAFNQISSESFGSEFSYFLAYINNNIVGICPCHTFKHGLVRQSYSNPSSYDLPYGGWIYDSGAVSLDQLLKHTIIRKNEALHISTNIELSSNTPYVSKAIKNHTQAQTGILRLEGNGTDEIFNGFKHKQKNKIRKAEKLGVRITPSESDDIDIFYDLMAELKTNVDKPIYPKEYFERIFSHYFHQGRALCLVARHEGTCISTLIVLANKAFATIWMGGRKMGIPNNLYQNELMIWEAIKWATKTGSKYFDLCTIDDERYANLARIKLSFSDQVLPYYHYSKKGLVYKVLNRLQKGFGIK